MPNIKAKMTEYRSGITPLRLILHILLIIFAAIFLLMRTNIINTVRDNEYSPSWLFLGPGIFTALFLLLLAENVYAKKIRLNNFNDLLPIFFGLMVIATLFSSFTNEYRARIAKNIIGVDFIKSFLDHQDARIRALAMLAVSSHNFFDTEAIGLIHSGLLDKDPLVQDAAKLVIENNLGIRFKNGTEGTGQAQKIMRDTAPSALLMRKGIP